MKFADFINTNPAYTASVFFLIGSITISWWVTENRGDVLAMDFYRKYQKTIKEYTKRKTEEEATRLGGSAVRHQGAEAFLRMINDVTHSTDVRIESLAPVVGNPFSYHATLVATFPTVLKMIRTFEYLGVRITELELEPYKISNPPEHRVTFTISRGGSVRTDYWNPLADGIQTKLCRDMIADSYSPKTEDEWGVESCDDQQIEGMGPEIDKCKRNAITGRVELEKVDFSRGLRNPFQMTSRKSGDTKKAPEVYDLSFAYEIQFTNVDPTRGRYVVIDGERIFRGDTLGKHTDAVTGRTYDIVVKRINRDGLHATSKDGKRAFFINKRRADEKRGHNQQ